MSTVLALRRISRQLAAAGVHPVSPWWTAQARRFYEHPSARTLLACVGRGGDKSRTSVIMAIAEVLSGDFAVPPGERHYHVHVAENRDEAAKTLSILESYLRILGVPFTRTGDTLDLEQMPRGFRVLACRVGAVSGFRCIGWTADEAAKWDDDGSDPSAEVIASIKAMTVTHAAARGRIISSPLATLGYFYDTWSAGDTPDQIVAHAPTWAANPGVTEEQTRRLEPDLRKWRREYAAVPMEGHEESLFDPALITRAERAEPGDVPHERGVTYLAAMDPSLGRNAWTFVIAGLRLVDGRAKASIVYAREWRASRGGQPLDPAAILGAIATACAPYRVARVWTDQYHGESLASIAARLKLGIEVVVDKPTAAQRLERYEGTLTRMLDDALELPREPHVRGDLLAVRRRVTKGADGFTIHMAVSADGRHADYAPAIVLVLSQLPRIAAIAAAYRAKSERFYESLALNNHFGPVEEARVAQARMDRATSSTSRSLTWQERADREWAEFVKSGRQQRISWPARRGRNPW